MSERLESLKAGVLTGLCVTFAFLITTLVNNLILAKYFQSLSKLDVDLLSWHWLFSGAIAGFSGLLFGVTYRYIIREDQNPQLKAGGVLAFGLVRGLAQVEVGVSDVQTILPFTVLGLESILWFGLAGISLDVAMQLSWIKPFN
jgi:hypothetical protein